MECAEPPDAEARPTPRAGPKDGGNRRFGATAFDINVYFIYEEFGCGGNAEYLAYRSSLQYLTSPTTLGSFPSSPSANVSASFSRRYSIRLSADAK